MAKTKIALRRPPKQFVQDSFELILQPYQSASELLTKLRCRKIGNFAAELVSRGHLPLINRETPRRLVRVTGEDLGLTDSASRQEIYAAAFRHRLRICHRQVGPDLYLESGLHSGLIASKPIFVEPSLWLLFEIREGKLCTDAGDPTIYFSPQREWYFELPRNVNA